MNARFFTARYKDSVLFVSLPALIGAPVVAVAAFWAIKSLPGALAAAALSILLTTLATSAMKRARPALKLSEDGILIDGLTLLDWSALERVRILPPFRETQPPGLELRFTERPGWPKGFKAIGPSPLWRPLESGLFLRLGLLEDAPETVAEAFNYFIRRRAVDAKPS
jgi:hypothetical protein